jgi:hypothetical protein
MSAARNASPCEISPRALPIPPRLHGLPGFVLRGGVPARRVPILVLGLSHANALAGALKSAPDPDFGVIVLRAGGYSRLDRINPPLLARFAPGTVVSMIGGNEHHRLGLLEGPEPFDFEEPTVPWLDEGRRLIPRSQVRAALEKRLSTTIAKLRLLRTHYRQPTAHVASPPPIADEAHLARHLGAFARNAGAEPRFTPAAVRLKLYRLQNAILREACAAEDVAFMEPVAHALDEEGFLAAPFRKRDPTHANERYGAAVAEEIRAFAGRPTWHAAEPHRTAERGIVHDAAPSL